MADESFYKKSQKRFDDYINSSSLILMASHSEELLRRYCDKGILMKGGEIIFYGSISEAFEMYRR
jgi:ABC-type polysaccharide/polyol phosphate transport system ATPase subunit